MKSNVLPVLARIHPVPRGRVSRTSVLVHLVVDERVLRRPRQRNGLWCFGALYSTHIGRSPYSKFLFCITRYATDEFPGQPKDACHPGGNPGANLSPQMPPDSGGICIEVGFRHHRFAPGLPPGWRFAFSVGRLRALPSRSVIGLKGEFLPPPPRRTRVRSLGHAALSLFNLSQPRPCLDHIANALSTITVSKLCAAKVPR